MAVALSILAHAAGVIIVVMWVRPQRISTSDTQLILLAPSDRPLEAALEYSEAPREQQARAPRGALLDVTPRVVPNRGAQGFSMGLRGMPGGSGSGVRGGFIPTELRPSYQTGHLWIPPLPLTREEIASRLEYLVALGGGDSGAGEGNGDGGGDGALDAELIDIAVTAIVQAYLDSVGNEPGADLEQLPAWTTEIAGLDFGIDQSWIYFAGLKIPAALLALLPLPHDGGNYFRDRNWEWMMDVRRDIYYSAWMADTKDEFKANVRKLRERKEREKRMTRNQMLEPAFVEDSTEVDSTGAAVEQTP
jgi:hypothetical protein